MNVKLRDEKSKLVKLRVGDLVRARLTGTDLVYMFDITRVTTLPYMTPRSRVYGGHRHSVHDPGICRIFRDGRPPYTFADIMRVLAIKDVYTQGEWFKVKVSVEVDMGGKDWTIKIDGGTLALARGEIPLPT